MLLGEDCIVNFSEDTIVIALIVEAGHDTVLETITQMCDLATRMQINVKCKNVGGHSVEIQPNKNPEEEFAKYNVNAPRRAMSNLANKGIKI